MPRSAHIGRVSSFDAPVAVRRLEGDQRPGADHRRGRGVAATGRRCASGSGTSSPQAPLGEGLQFDGATGDWRRLGHKVADQVYARLTGEGGYFDSRVAFVAASGPKEARRKQIGIMDYDGANPVMLTDGSALVLTPRISPDARRVLFTSYAQRHAAGDDARGRRPAAHGDLATPAA